MPDLRFADPYFLVLLLAVPFVLLAARSRGRTPAITMGSLATAVAVRRTWRVRLEPALLAVRVLAMVLLVLAIARPQRGEAVTVSEGEGIDIVLAFDTSSSMTQPFARRQTRLQAAEDVLSRFVEGRTNDRVGLVVFRGSTITLSPLTTDYRALRESVLSAGGLRLSDGTAIGTAIAESVNVLRGSSAESRIIILMTDGENNRHQIEPLAAARIAERLGVRVYTVGVVSRESNRSLSTINVDEEALREIANVTGAAYNRAEDPAALQQIYADIDALEKSNFQQQRLVRFDEWAPFVLVAAVCLLALELALRLTVFRRPA